MPTRLRFDELNALLGGYSNADLPYRNAELADNILDYLIYAYVWGVEDVAESLGLNIAPNAERMKDTIYQPTKGKTAFDRINEYADQGDMEGVRRVAETELHRVYNSAVYDEAVRNGAKTKTWKTMLDDRVRETHTWQEGVTVPIDAEFYIGADHAPAPGMFDLAENNVNCRCYLTVA